VAVDDRVIPGMVAILEARIERMTLLREAMDGWPRPLGDKFLLDYLKQLKRRVTLMIGLLGRVRWALINIKLEPPQLDEILALDHDHWRLVNGYLFTLKKYFEGELRIK